MKRICLAFWLLFTATAYAQKSFDFQPQLQAQGHYKVQHEQSTQIRMDVSADDKEDQKELLKALEAGGMKLPFVFSNVTKAKVDARLQAGKDKLMPIVLTIEDMEITQIVGGEIEKADVSETIGEQWKGKYSVAKGLQDEQAPSEGEEASVMEEIVREMLFFIQTQNHWSPKTLEKGDSFETEYPLDVPIPNQGDISLTISTTYTVEKIKSGKAWLKIEQHFDSRSALKGEESEGLRFTMTGDGDGMIVYNIDGKYVEDNHLRFEGDLFFEILGMRMQMDFVTVSDQQIQKL